MSLLGHPLCRLLGLNPTGDLADLTFYTSKRKGVVFFLKAPPKTPPTWWQRHQRNVFARCAEAWNNLTPQDRARWEAAALGAGLRMTGYNLWISWQTQHDRATIQTVERYSHVDLL